MKKSLLFAIVSIAVLLGLVAGQLLQVEKPVKGFPGLGGEFTLDSKAGPVSLSDFNGKVVVVYFGYVSCPDACPISLGKISAAMEKMTPEQREQLRVILISVDPERDTTQMLANYTGFFGKEFIGLTGTPEQISQVARNYRVLYQKVDTPDSDMEYTVDHSSSTYVIGKNGIVRFIVSYGSDYAEFRDRIIDALNDV